jgi:hypothetical protein
VCVEGCEEPAGGVELRGEEDGVKSL